MKFFLYFTVSIRQFMLPMDLVIIVKWLHVSSTSTIMAKAGEQVPMFKTNSGERSSSVSFPKLRPGKDGNFQVWLPPAAWCCSCWMPTQVPDCWAFCCRMSLARPLPLHVPLPNSCRWLVTQVWDMSRRNRMVLVLVDHSGLDTRRKRRIQLSWHVCVHVEGVAFSFSPSTPWEIGPLRLVGLLIVGAWVGSVGLWTQ